LCASLDWLFLFCQSCNGGQCRSCICSPIQLWFVMVQVKVTISPVVLPPSHTITISKLRGLNCRRVIPESSNRGVNTVAQIRRYLCFVIRLNHLSCPRLWSASAMLPAVAGSQERYPTMKYHQLGWVWALFFSTHRAQFFARKEGRSCR